MSRGTLGSTRGVTGASTFRLASWATKIPPQLAAPYLHHIDKMPYSAVWRTAIQPKWPRGPIREAIETGRLIQMIIPDPNMSAAEQAIELVRRLNDPKFAAGASQISRELQEIQLSDHGWAAADAMLDHADANIKFYGALTLQIKLNKDRSVLLDQHNISLGILTPRRSTLNEQAAAELRSRLVLWFVSLRPVPCPIRPLIVSPHRFALH